MRKNPCGASLKLSEFMPGDHSGIGELIPESCPLISTCVSMTHVHTHTHTQSPRMTIVQDLTLWRHRMKQYFPRKMSKVKLCVASMHNSDSLWAVVSLLPGNLKPSCCNCEPAKEISTWISRWKKNKQITLISWVFRKPLAS